MPHKPLPLCVLIPLDAVLAAGCLLTFAYYHHVKPQVTKADENLLEYIDSLKQESAPDATAPVTEVTNTTGDLTVTETTAISVMTDENGSAVTNGTTGKSRVTGGTDTTAETDETGNSGGPDTPDTAPTAKTTKGTTTTTTTGPQYDRSGFGAKWPELFSLGNEIEQTDTSYRSHDIYVTLSDYTYADSVCHVADFYIRSTDCFQYAFAQDGDPNTYANGLVTGLQENMVTMCERTNAVVAINGDFMGGRQIGYVIRDGYPWRTEPWNDVLALYNDGVCESFTKDEFDVYAAFNRGIRHSFAFGPALVRGGVTNIGWTSSMLQRKEPRSGFGYFEPGHYCFIAVDGRGMGGSLGMTADEFAGFCGWLGCTEAFNLDGGKTSQLAFCGKIVNLPDGYNGDRDSLRGMSDIYFIGEAN